MRKRLRKKTGKLNRKEWRAMGFVPVDEYQHEDPNAVKSAVDTLMRYGVPKVWCGNVRTYVVKSNMAVGRHQVGCTAGVRWL